MKGTNGTAIPEMTLDTHPSRLGRAGHRALLVAIAVGMLVTLYGARFGTADIEESANSAFSAGADYSAHFSDDREIGTHTIFGVPTYDTLQGTGDRLPYQASWGQSVTWWLRWLVSWEHYTALRTLVFAVPALWLCLMTLQSWVVRLSNLNLILFGILSSSSYGLFLRQNEWSDHYVATVGTVAVSMFLMHRRFHDSASSASEGPQVFSVFCLAISLNGVFTGHPGFFPITIAVWAALIGSFATSQTFRTRLRAWISTSRLPLGLLLVATLSTFAAVLLDLLGELEGQPFGSSRLERTQGLFSEYAFAGVYGLSDGGMLPAFMKSAVASVLGTTLMPMFMLLDGVLPQFARSSDFREMPRVEFSGSLVVLAVVFGWHALSHSRVRPLVLRLVVAQAIIWLFVVGSALDVLPAVFAASGAWMTLAIVLVFNVFLAWLVLASFPKIHRVPRWLALVNLSLVGLWCLYQFGFTSFGSVLQLPTRHEAWFRSAETLERSEWYSERQSAPGRIMMVETPNFYDFLPFVALGQPVVATADPKMRASNQLQGSYAFNYSVNPPTFEDLDSEQVELVLDFLQVRTLLVGRPLFSNQATQSRRPQVIDRLGSALTPTVRLQLSRAIFDVYVRKGFSAFVLDRATISDIAACPILQRNCPVIAGSHARARSVVPRLTLCEETCLWRFESPDLDSGDALVLPVTYDKTLIVRDAAGTRLITANAGGFLATYGDGNLPSTTLMIDFQPDLRMMSRVIASYVNLVSMFVLAGMMLYRVAVSLRLRNLRV
jgi:hypothetical protein